MLNQHYHASSLNHLFCSCRSSEGIASLVTDKTASNFINRVELAHQLAQRLDARTTVLQSSLLSRIADHSVSLKLDYELCGWATKTRGVWGLIAERLDDFIIHNLMDINEPDPVAKAIKAAFDDATVVACTSGNHGIATAQLLQLLSYKYGFKINLEIIIPEDSPSAKREHLEDLGVNISTYSPSEDRIAKMNQICSSIQKTGKTALPFPTEPIHGHEGGFVGLATLGKEIAQDMNHGVTVFLPASSGPTAAAVLRYFKETNSAHKVHISQDICNGCLSGVFLNELIASTHTKFDDIYVKGKILDQMRCCGKSVNGLSTRHINDIAAPIFSRYLLPDELTFVSPTLMAVGSLIVYLETRNHLQAMKPELAGACSVAALLARSLQDLKARNELRKILEDSDFTWAQLAAIAEITEDDLTDTLSTRPPHTFIATSRPEESLCVITGANCRQPYFIALQKGDTELASREREFAHPLYQAQIAEGWDRVLEGIKNPDL